MTRLNYMETAGFKIVIALFLSLLFLTSVVAESTNSNSQEEGVGFFENIWENIQETFSEEDITGKLTANPANSEVIKNAQKEKKIKRSK